MTPFAIDGPPAVAESLLATATARWDGWFLLHGLRAVSALRGGRCDVAAEQFLVLLDFGIERREAPALVSECRRTREATQ